MSEINRVCVYCGSSGHVDPVYNDMAARLGRGIAGAGWDVVFGGGRAGLMGIVADTAMEAGAKVFGVIPAHIQDREIGHTGLTGLEIVDNMHQRKARMVELSDAFVILPGGLGTLDELFEILTWKQLGLHDMPIVIVNEGGYWDLLFDLMDHMQNKKFVGKNNASLYIIADSVEDVPGLLREAPRERFSPETKWM